MNEDCVGLIEVLGKENADKVRSAITDALIENITEVLKEYYIIDSDIVRKQINAMAEECFDTVKEKYMDAMTEAIEQKFKDCLKKLDTE